MTPLLAPQSIAVVGGSPRAGTVGNSTIKSLLAGRYPGTLNVVNPRYESVESLVSYPTLADLPSAPDMAILSVGAHRMENIMREALDAGVRSAVIFDPCFYENDKSPVLLDRLKAMVREAQIPVCGGNGMGYYHHEESTFASFSQPETTESGHIAAFCHSGSAFGLLVHADPRYRFNMVTSQGQEIGANVAEYMDYALEQPSTRVIALFLETVRDPSRFVDVLAKANKRQIPVVATKVGRTKESARLAQTHSGALAGDDAAFDAVCKCYGVIRTDDLDTLLATCQILAMGRRPDVGGFAAVLDSGGLREQMMDIAADIGLEFATLEAHTVSQLSARLPHGLEPVNPLDAAGPITDDYVSVFADCLDIVARDANTALIAQEIYATDIQSGYGMLDAAKQMPNKHDKPYVVTYSLATVRNSSTARDLLAHGIPLINGTKNLLHAVNNAFAFRDFLRRPGEILPTLDSSAVARAHETLEQDDTPREQAALKLLADLGMNTVQCGECDSEDAAVALAESLGFPVVLKTASDRIFHKSDVDGVRLNLKNPRAVKEAYRQVSILGSRVVVAEMAGKGIELAFGMINDPQFGPIVMVGAGGTLVEVVNDKRFALPPFGPRSAKRLLKDLAIAPMFDGVRSGPAIDIEAIASTLSRYSVICHAMGGLGLEMDLNPVIASSHGCTVVDALITRDGEFRG